MSRAALLLALPLLLACTKKEAPVADTSAAIADTSAAVGAPLNVAGSWNMSVMALDKDTVLTTYVLDATGDQAGWKMTFPGRDPLDIRVISVDADSVVTEVGPYESVLQKGAKVNLVHSALHLEGDKLVGSSVVHYDKKTADSVVNLRQEGTRK